MTQGFVNTGKYVPVFANDWNRDAMESYCANFDRTRRHTVPGDIVGLVEDPGFSFPKADVVIGMRRSGKTWFCFQKINQLLHNLSVTYR